MITEISYDKDLLGNEVRGTNTSYGVYQLYRQAMMTSAKIFQNIYLETVW